MKLNSDIINTLAGSYCVAIMLSFIWGQWLYQDIYARIKKEDAENGVEIYHDEPLDPWQKRILKRRTYHQFKVPIPFIRISKYPETNKIIKEYNFCVKLYWLLALFVLPFMYIIHLLN